ncbi:GTPase HflX, partial [Gilvimarinus sp. 1_MG-2023]|nr:GTPase HflX [Gilvimarinus sp. 1_MG-2023]
YMEQVEEVLDEIGAGDLPQLRVCNKIDLLNMEPRIDRDEEGTPVAVGLSAQAGTGIELLFEAISELLGEERIEGDL